METVDLSLPGEDYGRYTFGADDVVLIAMPSFGGLAPQAALAIKKACSVPKENELFL